MSDVAEKQTEAELESELADLRAEQEAIKVQVEEAARARDETTKAYRASRRRRPRIIRGGVAIYETAWTVEDEAHEAEVLEQEETIQAANRRSRELGEAIEDRRRALLQERRREKARAEAAPVGPLEAEIEAAKVAYDALVRAQEAIPGQIEAAHQSGDAEAIVEAQTLARDHPVRVGAALTVLLNAEVRHAASAAAALDGVAEAAEAALSTAAEDLLAAQERHDKALHDLRCVSGDQQQWRGRQHRLAQELDQHLSRQRGVT